MVDHKREHVSNELKDQTWSRDYGNNFMATCISCKTTTINSRKCEYDHIVPVSKGGKSTLNNLQAICKSCNRKKATKIIRYTPEQAQINVDEQIAKSLAGLSTNVMIPPKIGPAMVPDHIPYESIKPKQDPYFKMVRIFEEFFPYFHVRAHIRREYDDGYNGRYGEDLYARYRILIDDINEGRKPESSRMNHLILEFQNSDAWSDTNFIFNRSHYERLKFSQMQTKWNKAVSEYNNTKNK